MKTLIPLMTFLTVIFVTACSVVTKNHTPAVFPTLRSSLPDATNMIVGNNLGELYNNFSTVDHRFYLEVAAGVLVRDIQPSIILNGEEYKMSGSQNGRGIWTFDSPDQCTENYSYYYKTSYSVPLSNGKKIALLGSPSESYTTSVNHFGEVVWYTNREIQEVAQPAEFDMGLGNVQLHIIVKNLSGSPVNFKTELIFTDHNQFKMKPGIEDFVELICGESISVSIFWNRIETRDKASCVLKFTVRNSNNIDVNYQIKVNASFLT